MAYDTDEEQIEAIKQWWKENGRSVMIGAVIVLVAFFGSRQWQDSQVSNAERASALYQEMVNYVQAADEQQLDEASFTASLNLHHQLRSDFANSIYSRYSSLLMARLHVEEGDLQAAADELRWVMENRSLGLFRSVDEEVSLIARSRLARVVLAQGLADEALAILSAVNPGAFAGTFSEIEGDAYLVLGRQAEARAAYERALAMGTNSEIVQLKLEAIDS